MRYSQYAGVFASLALVFSGFLEWTWYPDLQTSFTGYHSEANIYGKPALLFNLLAAVAIAFFLISRTWAKRWNLLVTAITLAFAIRTFILFTACYRGICPSKQTGIWVMMGSAALMMICTLLPDTPLSGKSAGDQSK